MCWGAAFDAGMVEDGFSTKDFSAALPSACKNQALRDAKSVYAKAQKIGRLPILKKPICHWNNQNWQMESGQLTLPVSLDGKRSRSALPVSREN